VGTAFDLNQQTMFRPDEQQHEELSPLVEHVQYFSGGLKYLSCCHEIKWGDVMLPVLILKCNVLLSTKI